MMALTRWSFMHPSFSTLRPIPSKKEMLVCSAGLVPVLGDQSQQHSSASTAGLVERFLIRCDQH